MAWYFRAAVYARFAFFVVLGNFFAFKRKGVFAWADYKDYT
jgi:hypothetical protein